MVTHPSTNPTRPDLTSELLCLPSLFWAKIFSQIPPSPPSGFLLSVFSLYPRLASYCKYRISSNNNIEVIHGTHLFYYFANQKSKWKQFLQSSMFNLLSATLHLPRVYENLGCFARLSHSKLTGPSIWFCKEKHNKFKLKYHLILNDTALHYTTLHYTSLHSIVWSLNSGKLMNIQQWRERLCTYVCCMYVCKNVWMYVCM